MKAGEKFKFTYTLTTVNDASTKWANRMDHYYKIGNHDIHMAEILFCLGLIVILGLTVFCMMEYTVRRDIRSIGENMSSIKITKQQRLNQTKKSLINSDSIEEETGLVGSDNPQSSSEKYLNEQLEKSRPGVAWHKLQFDIYRAPDNSNGFAASVGIGAQIFGMTIVTLIMTVLFFSNQALRPYTFVISGTILALMGWVNGYVTSRLLKFFGASDWLLSALLSSLAFPLWLMTSLTVVDIIEWDTEGSAMPYTMALMWIFGYLFFSIPLSMHGSYIGFTDTLALKPKVNLVRRIIPDQPWFNHPVLVLPIFGLIIFASIYYEFAYVLESMWHSYTIYAMFGFLLLNLYLTAVVISLLSTIQTYFMLMYGNYCWWWRSFALGVSAGFYMTVYTVWYALKTLDADFLGSEMIYAVYMYIFILCFMMMCGSIAVISSYYFI